MKKDNTLSHIWSILCSNMSVDSQTNNLTLFNIVEKLTINIPKSDVEKRKQEGAEGYMVATQLAIVSRFRRDSTKVAVKFDYRAKLLTEEGKEIMQTGRTVGIDTGIRSLRVGTNLTHLPVTTSGDYLFVVEIKERGEDRFKKVGEIPLEVEVVIVEDSTNPVNG